ncbi:MAG: hypothetical protein WCA38_04855 [Candidatus Acidiferrales bacterium]
MKNFFADTLDEAMKIAPMGTEAGASFMMVVSYWEQACALLKFFGVWERVKPTIPEARKRFVNNQFLENLEKAAQRFEAWAESRNPGQVAATRQFGQQMRTQFASAAKA